MGENAGAEESMLAEARAEVSCADQKASMVLASIGIGFGTTLGGLLAGDWTPSDQGSGEFAWWLGVAFAVVSVIEASSAVWPRFSQHKGEAAGVSYWGEVAALSSFEKLSETLEAHPPDPVDRTRRQLWELSNIVRVKYRLIRAAFICAALAVVSFAVSMVIAPSW